MISVKENEKVYKMLVKNNNNKLSNSVIKYYTNLYIS